MAELQQARRYLLSQERKLQKYLVENPEVVVLHSIPQPNNTFHGRVYGETYLDENGSKNLRVRFK